MLDRRAATMSRATIAKSLSTYKSELNLWKGFCIIFNIVPLAPLLGEVLRYLSIFSNGLSAEKYLQAIRWVFRYCRVADNSVLYHPSVKQLLVGARKITEGSGLRKKFTYLLPVQVIELVAQARIAGEHDIAAAFVLASQFLSRVKDEILNIHYDGGPQWRSQFASTANFISFKKSDGVSSLELHLKSRKNAPRGAVLTRRCLCSKTKVNPLCTVHAVMFILKPQLRTCGAIVADKVFNISYDRFTRRLHYYGAAARIENADKLSSKAFRRGTAIYMLQSKHPLSQVLEAGGWRSAAFMHYILKEDVDEMVLFAELAELSDDDKDDAPKLKASNKRAPVGSCLIAGQPAITDFLPKRRTEGPDSVIWTPP